MIPKQLCQPEFRFCLLKAKEKKPFENQWQTTANYAFDSPKLLQHIERGDNYGIVCGPGGLRGLDIDDPELAKKLAKELKTLTAVTGRDGHHFFIKSEYDTNHVLPSKKGEMRCKNMQVVGAGSVHPNGKKYRIINDQPIVELSKEQVAVLIAPYLKKENTNKEGKSRETKNRDTSRSATEFWEVHKLVKQGKSKTEVFDKMKAFVKWTTSSPQYQQLTYERAQAIVQKRAAQKEAQRKATKTPSFDFVSDKPEKEIDTLDELRAVIVRNFPSIWFELRACLSAYSCMALKNLNGCPSINLVGNPSGEKTTVLSFLYSQKLAYLSDDFTPRAFVSHSANVSKEDLEQVDLLPRIKNRVLVTPELAPLFEASKDRLIENFSMLTRVLDGEGLNRDSGTHGHRGYSGDYKFVWIGATTPLRAGVWNVMGKIGNRLFFLNMREKRRSDADYLTMFSGKAYEKKVEECRGAVTSFLNNLFKKHGIRTLDWDPEQDILLLPEIIKYAKFLSRLRGSLMTWKGEERGDYEHSFPIVEEPPRAINALYNLAKGHALIKGRTFLQQEDLEIVEAVCMSSMPHDRSEFLKLIAKHEGRLTTKQIEKELGCSTQTASRTMKIFEVLGVVTMKNIQVEQSGIGRPMNYVELKDEFKPLLEAQGMNDGTNNTFHQTNGASVEYDGLGPKDFVEKHPKQPHTQVSNDGRKGLFQHNNTARVKEWVNNNPGMNEKQAQETFGKEIIKRLLTRGELGRPAQGELAVYVHEMAGVTQ
jgi:hypothetical protein